MPSVIIFVVAIYAAMKNNSVISYPLSQFYPFGSIAADNNLPANDDGFTSSIPISVPFPFFGSSYSSVYMRNYDMYTTILNIQSNKMSITMVT